jgi:aryl-alcohol dehydrogenase-like predicted oxidoreductase
MTETSTTSRQRPGGTAVLGGRQVARIGFGAGQLARLRGDLDAAVGVVRRAVELGVDHIDTAQFYGLGFVNEVLAAALGPDDEVVIATKVGADPDPDGPIPLKRAQRPEQLRASVLDNLRTLGVDRLDLVNLRRLDVGPGVEAVGDQMVDLDDQLAEMVAMRDEGLIADIGISAVDLDGLRRALPAGVVCVQNAYSLKTRTYEALLELSQVEGLAWAPFYPLGGDFPGMPRVVEEPAVIETAARLGVAPSQVGLAWLLRHSANTLLIPGTSRFAHLEQNLTIGELELDDAAMAALDAVSAPGGDRIPFWRPGH